MNGERIIIVLASRPTTRRDFDDVAMIHTVLHITGKKSGLTLIQTETEETAWDTQSNMLRLDV